MKYLCCNSTIFYQQDKKLSGFGYLSEGSLLCPCISKNNKPYIRVFDDVVNRCKPMKDRPNEFQGYVTINTEEPAAIVTYTNTATDL